MKLQLVRDKNDRGSEVAFAPFVYVGKLLVKLRCERGFNEILLN